MFLLYLHANQPRWLWNARIVQIAAVYIAYFFLSAAWSNGLGWLAMADLLRVGLLVFLFFAVTVLLAVNEDAFESRLFRWFCLVGGASLILVFLIQLPALDKDHWRLAGFGRAAQPVIGSTLFGFIFLVAGLALLPQASGKGERVLWLVIMALCAAFILMASSRGPLLALAAALCSAFALAHRRLAIAVVGLLGAAILVGLSVDFRPVSELFARGSSGHIALWQQALQAIAERPWFGHGSLVEISFEGKHGLSRSPHNLLLANHLYGGVPATLLLGALFAAGAAGALRVAREGKPIYLVLLVFGFVAALFDTRTLVQNLGREWITIWLPLALLAGHMIRAQRTHSPAPGEKTAGPTP